MAVPEEMRSLFKGESPRQGLVSKKKKKKKTQQTNCQIALILRVYLASIFFSSGGGFCLQDLTIEEKKPHTQLCIVRCGTKVGSQHTVGFQFLILFDPIV